MWWKGCPGQENIMHPALRSFFSSLAALAFAWLGAISVMAQAPSKLLSESLRSVHSVEDLGADPAGAELTSLGPNASIISQARAEVMAILSAQNSCSAWFRSAESEAADKFRSLRFAMDFSGNGDIVRVESWDRMPVYYQPYVARTLQNVGWGSTITLNDKGAFFKNSAPVRLIVYSNERGYAIAARRLYVGDFSGATREAQILTLLHEFGHVVDLLPIDAGMGGGPQLSTRNTELVLRHCGADIKKAAKRSPLLDSAFSVSPPPLADRAKRVGPGGNLQ
jgi:hypothetical protein